MAVQIRLSPQFAPNFGGVWEWLAQIVNWALVLNIGSAKLNWYVFPIIVKVSECLGNALPWRTSEAVTKTKILSPKITNCLVGPSPKYQPVLSMRTFPWRRKQGLIKTTTGIIVEEAGPRIRPNSERQKWTNLRFKLEKKEIVWLLDNWTLRIIWPQEPVEGR